MEPLFKYKDDQYMFKGVNHTREVVRAILLDEHNNVCLEYLLDEKTKSIEKVRNEAKGLYEKH